MEEIKIEDWCLWDWHKQSDFLLMDGDIDRLPTLPKQDTKRYYYNQSKQTWSKKSCTIFWAVGAISDLMNYEFSLDEIKEIDNLSYEKGRTKWAWWYVWFAVDLVCKWWNSDKNKTSKYGEVVYYSVDMKNDAVISAVTEKNYDIVTWYYWNSKYNSDYQSDLCLDGTSFWTQTYWHCINVIWLNWNLYVKDNYNGAKYNVYKLANPTSKITCWHNTWYVITKVDNSEEIKRLNELKVKLNTAINTNSEIRHLVNDENYKAVLNYSNNANRKKLDTVNEMLKNLGQ